MKTLEPLDPDLRALVDLAEGDEAATPATLDEVHERLRGSIARSAWAPTLTAIGGAIIVIGVVVAGTMRVGTGDTVDTIAPVVAEVAVAPVVAPAVVSAPPVAEAPRVESAPPPERSVRAPRAPTAAAAAAAAAPAPLEDRDAEGALLERARAALRASDFGEATELLELHARTWPNGAFGEERDALRALVAVRLRAPDAAAQAATFAERHPTSVYNAMLREALRTAE